MKNKQILGILVLLLGLGSQPLMANELLIGAKAGINNFDLNGFEGEDPSLDASIQIGYEFLDLALFDLAAEVEFTTSLTEGEVNNNDYSNESVGAFLSLRTAGPIYFIGRFGLVSSDIDLENSVVLDDEAVAAGLGVGFSTGFRWELEVTNYEYDEIGSSLYLSLGFSF